MFGIKLSEHYFEKFNIFRHHLIRLSDLDLISVDDPEYLHEEAATELLINIYKTFGNHIQSFDHEYQIQEKINLLLSNLQYNDFLNVFSKCESLFEDKDKEQHRYPLGHLVLMLFKIPDYLMDKENKFNLYKNYTHGLGNFYYHIGDYVKSIEYHDKAIALDNNNPDAYDGKGISLSRLGENYEAIKQYNKAIENDPTHPNAHYNKAISLYNLEDDPNAIKEFNKAIRLNPSDPDAHYFKALCLHRLGKDKNALNEYSKAIEIDPFYKNAYIGRGSSYAQLGKDKKGYHRF